MSKNFLTSLLKFYPYVWPVLFVCGGLYSLASSHAHFEVFGINFALHDLMWFLMAFAHAEVYWRSRSQKTQALES